MNNLHDTQKTNLGALMFVCPNCGAFATTDVETIDNGTVLVCSKCGGKAVVAITAFERPTGSETAKVVVSNTGEMEIHLGGGVTRTLPPHQAEQLARQILSLVPKAREVEDDYLEWLQDEVTEEVLSME